ncbi:MAG: 23S rRNA (adenine(2503)-C(2))-methyltransferase RlmN [Peptococcaceae bacterium]|jgi:23S rRNA (adenine2503-C2)-methyltransferase|nr:23S rRNA (adenine(2503)-C(2))-methyltransferase RlmN [Peptococcaceae bacterium]
MGKDYKVSSAKVNLRDLTLPQLEIIFSDLGVEKYRAKQAAEWIFKKGVFSFDEMTNLSKNLREKMAGFAWLSYPEIHTKEVSQQGETIKYLFRLHDGETVESVLMKHDYGNAVCVSTQVGCRMNCRLCASGLEGLIRNLSAGEIYDQVLGIQQDTGQRVSHVVLMGSGEPLDNYHATLGFITNIIAEYGLNISARHITLSTCGIVPAIRALAGEKLALTLAVSLHAPEDSLRDTLVPINKKYPLKQLIPSCAYYAEETGRRVTFEYALIDGINDRREHAQQLAQLLQGMLCHVNLIPANPVAERGVVPAGRSQVSLFKDILERQGIATTLRRKLGADINAACGQLRRRVLST